jgi:uncharacterized protein (TIGR02246 family)
MDTLNIRRPLPAALLTCAVAALIAGGTAVSGAATSPGGDTPGGPRPSRASCHTQRDVLAQDVLRPVLAGWAANDAEVVAAAFTPDASLIVPGEDTYLTSRDQIRAYFEMIFAGAFKGARATATVLDVKCTSRHTAVVVTQGGLLFPGETEVPQERIGRQTWVVVRHRGNWAATAYQNSRITSG